jgi:Tol biopolymer transport system component
MRSRFHLVLVLGVALCVGCSEQPTSLVHNRGGPSLLTAQGSDGSLAGPLLAFASAPTSPCCLFNVFVMTLNGSKQTQLTDEPDYNARPDWSHDGRRLAYTACRESDGGNCEIYVMNADGSSKTNLTNTLFAFDGVPAWSPDDKKIAFQSDRDGNQEIYVMNADGSNQVRLTFNDAFDQQPSWSPEGSKLAFQSDRDGNNEIYVMNVDGSVPVNLTHNPGSDERNPRWSPRGDKIAFDSNRDGHSLIYVMGSDGSGQTRLTNNPREDYGPAWSPNANQIAFTRQVDDNLNFDIYVMKPDGSSQQRVTSSPGWEADPAWTNGVSTSPSTQFHFVSNGDFGSVSWFAPDPAGGFTFGAISVSRGGPTNAPQTSLSYFVFQCDPFGSCTDVRDGFGLIPNNDLSGGGRALSLRTNTSGNPDFVTSAGPTGSISVDWRANGLFTQSASGTNQVSLPGFTQTFQGGSTSASASAAGSIVGLAISPNGSAGIGTNRQVTIDITRTNTLAAAALTLTVDGSGQTERTSLGSSIPLLLVGATSPASQFHFVSNGGSGSVSWFAPDPAGGFIFGSLSVSRGGPTNAPQTSLSYFVFQCDPFGSCTDVRDGFGLIPNNDLSGGGTSLSLRTNTTGSPNFFTFAGPAGPVSVDWRANGLFTQSSNGTNQISFPGFTQKLQGGSTSASANAAGSIVGLAISPNGSATIGTNHQVTIDISH